MFLTDPAHQWASRNLNRLPEGKRFPWWFIPIVGAWELLLTVLLSWSGPGNLHAWYAQLMISMLMGGAVYSHVFAERMPSKSLGAFLMLFASILDPALCSTATKLPTVAPFSSSIPNTNMQQISLLFSTMCGGLPFHLGMFIVGILLGFVASSLGTRTKTE